MESPYLRSAFAFLTSEGDNFDSILVSNKPNKMTDMMTDVVGRQIAMLQQ